MISAWHCEMVAWLFLLPGLVYESKRYEYLNRLNGKLRAIWEGMRHVHKSVVDSFQNAVDTES